jgi:hypothetical protein
MMMMMAMMVIIIIIEIIEIRDNEKGTSMSLNAAILGERKVIK